MLSLRNANTNAVVNDRRDRTNVAGICELCFVGLMRSLRVHASRVLESSVYVPGQKPGYQLAIQDAIRALAAIHSSALASPRTWRPERPFRLLAFACTS